MRQTCRALIQHCSPSAPLTRREAPQQMAVLLGTVPMQSAESPCPQICQEIALRWTDVGQDNNE